VKPDAIYFDLDGTLVDSEHLHAVSWNNTLVDFGIRLDEYQFCKQFAGRPTLEAAKEIVVQYQLAILPHDLAELKHTQFAKLTKTQLPTLLPDAKKLLAWCRTQGFKVALVTGSAKAEAEAILAGHQLFSAFDTIVTRDDVIKPKPNPEAYQQAISAFNLSAQNGIAVEDTITGATSAVGAGLYTIVKPNKYNQDDDFSKANAVCSSLHEVQKLISNKIM
jgi:HAD superfamily hydrolase (TIGR01509 family)